MREGRQAFEARRGPTRPTELGQVWLLFHPGPDAQDRLRRAFAIVLAAAMRDSSESTPQSPEEALPYEASLDWPLPL